MLLDEGLYVERLPRDLELPALIGSGRDDFVQNLHLLLFRDRHPVIPARYAARVDHEIWVVLKKPLAANLHGPVIDTRYNQTRALPPDFQNKSPPLASRCRDRNHTGFRRAGPTTALRHRWQPRQAWSNHGLSQRGQSRSNPACCRYCRVNSTLIRKRSEVQVLAGPPKGGPTGRRTRSAT